MSMGQPECIHSLGWKYSIYVEQRVNYLKATKDTKLNMIFLLMENNLSVFTSTNCKELWSKSPKQTNKQNKKHERNK